MLLIHHSPPKSNNSLYDDGDLLLLKKYKKKVPASIDEDCGGFHLAEETLVAHALGFWCQGAGNNNEVALRHKCVQGN